MSIEALDWAFKLKLQDGAAKGVLLALCNHYNPKNSGCWPGVERLQLETGLTRRTVQRALRRLERWHLVLSCVGMKRTTFYEVRVNTWFPSDLIGADLPSADLLLFGVVIRRCGYSGVDKLRSVVEGGVSLTRGGVIECTHPWRSDALIIIEPEYNHFADKEMLASEINDWELQQMGWVRPSHAKPSCVVQEGASHAQ